MAAAIVSTGHRAGIDLEHIDDRAWRVRHRFLNAAELEACPGDHGRAYLTLCWCAKEAVYKWHGDGGISFREHIRLRPFMPGPAGQISGYLEQGASSCPFRLHYLLEDTFALAWTMTP
ncbi:hypothetical protein GCM10023143_27850 [Compostibacter hankyongensis]|uniref:4'-phosphopantetheinyl transferase domain-containing protein n=2 Tax=Compostibacter hankyongensis TaxID=1007089 RepID=A0ABP8G2L5_9BACT